MATELQVSEMTVRRDFAELERGGHLVRTHGGALPSESIPGYTVDREEPAFEARLRQHRGVKERIAAAALELVGESRTVVLDVGTTTYLLAQRLASRPNTRFFTNSLRIATLLGSKGNDVYIPGGQIRGDEMSICGPTAVSCLENLWFDIAFIGVSGVTAAGYFDYSLEDSEIKRVYLKRSTKKVILCDAVKFHRMSLAQVSELAEADMLVTDTEPPPDIAAALAMAEVEVRIAPELPAPLLEGGR